MCEVKLYQQEKLKKIYLNYLSLKQGNGNHFVPQSFKYSCQSHCNIKIKHNYYKNVKLL